MPFVCLLSTVTFSLSFVHLYTPFLYNPFLSLSLSLSVYFEYNSLLTVSVSHQFLHFFTIFLFLCFSFQWFILNSILFSLCLFFKWTIFGLFLFIFGLFKQTTQILQQINVKKCPSSIRCQDSNSQPSDYESPPLTTRPGLPPIFSICWRLSLQSFYLCLFVFPYFLPSFPSSSSFARLSMHGAL